MEDTLVSSGSFPSPPSSPRPAGQRGCLQQGSSAPQTHRPLPLFAQEQPERCSPPPVPAGRIPPPAASPWDAWAGGGAGSCTAAPEELRIAPDVYFTRCKTFCRGFF